MTGNWCEHCGYAWGRHTEARRVECRRALRDRPRWVEMDPES